MQQDSAATSTTRVPTILGDWGTSRLRLWLCDTGDDLPAVRGVAEGPGAKFTEDFPGAFRDAAARLPGHPADCPVVLCGMVGSNIGWRETPYAPCPADWRDLISRAVVLELDQHPVVIMPGASCCNRFGYTDVMRGEETQLLGISTALPPENRRRLVCLAGTHTKWATLRSTVLEGFATTLQGELYELLRQHSVLIPGKGRPPETPFTRGASSYQAAVDFLRMNEELALLQALFSTRSRTITRELAASDAESWLSGLLIGADVRDTGRAILAGEDIEPPVLVVGDRGLTEAYALAMRQFGIETQCFAGDDCAVRGLAASSRLLGAGVSR